jgi:MFS family permease
MSTDDAIPHVAAAQLAPMRDGPFEWYRVLDRHGRRAFIAAFSGFGLDSLDFWVLPLALDAIIQDLQISAGAAGLLSTATLLSSAIGGTLAGVLADRIGRTRALQVTIAMYTIFTALCGFATDFWTLLVLRSLQGLGFGGEWAAGAVLIAEYAHPKYRGRTLAWVQAAWAVGWAIAVLASMLVFSVAHSALGWRILFWMGVLPGFLILWIRRHVRDAPARVTAHATPKRPWRFGIFSRGLWRTTVLASLLATGVQGGYYTLATWLPKYLKDARGLTIVGSGPYLASLISGAFLGYITGGVLADRFGRKRTFAVFALISAVAIVAYTRVPHGANGLILLLGFPLGFSMSAIFSGFGSFLAELYPAELRGLGQGFTYSVGRALGAAFPFVVGLLGVGGAMAFGAIGYGVAMLALLGLPETRGRELT